MIDSLVKSYKCPECSEWVNDGNVDIMWAAWTTINIDIMCENCWKHSMIKTEILSIDLSKNGINLDNIWKLKDTLVNSWKLISNKQSIKDEQIVDLNKDLKKRKLNVTDLLWDK